jgi:hypothetical protein
MDFGEIPHKNVYAMPFDNSEFLKNQYIESPTLLGDEGELSPIFLIFSLELNKFRRKIRMQPRSENVTFPEYWFSTRHTLLVFSGIPEILFIFSTDYVIIR